MIYNLLVLATLCQGGVQPIQSADDPVTFRHPVASASQVVEALGRQVGLTLTAAPALANEPIAVAVRDVPLKRLMDRIADVTAADWVKGSHGLILTPSATKAREQGRMEVATWRARLAKWCEATQTALARPYDEKTIESNLWKRRELQKRVEAGEAGIYRQIRALRSESPVERALQRIMVALGPDTLAQIQDQERVVFAVNPTPMQRKLPSSAEAALEQLRQELFMWSAAAQKLPTNEHDDHYLSQERLAEQWGKKPFRVLVSIERVSLAGLDSTLSASLRLYDSEGAKLCEADEVIALQESDIENRAALDKPDPNDVSIPLTPETQEWRRAFFREDADEARPKDEGTPASILSRALDPVRHEPCSPITTDLLFAVADLKGKNVVACVPDIALMLNEVPQEYLKLDLLLNLLERYGFFHFVQEQDFFTALPTFPVTERAQRLNRKAFRTYLTRIVETDGALDPIAEFAAGTTSDRFFLAEQYRFEVLRIGRDSDDYGCLLPFYGALSSSQRQALKRGGALAFGSLTPAQKAKVVVPLFGPENGFVGSSLTLEFESEDVGSIPDAPSAEHSHDRDANPSEQRSAPESDEIEENELRLEPTESLPRGIPADAMITMKAHRVRRLRNADAQGPEPSSGMDLDTVAWIAFSQERPDLFASQDRMTLPKRFEVLSGSEHEMRIAFNRMISARSSWTEWLPRDSKTYTWETLPADIRREIDAQIAELRKEYKDAKPGEGGIEEGPPPSRRPPPPPR